MLTNPISLDDLRSDDSVARNFRTVSDAELLSGDWRKESGRVEHLFTPTALNPLLRPQEGISNYWFEESPAFYVDLTPTAKFAQHNGFRATYLTDPPCTECVVQINFAARPARPGFHHIGSTVIIESGKPLTLGAVIDQALDSQYVWIRTAREQRFPKEKPTDTKLSDQIDEMEKRHNCKIEIHTDYQGLYLGIHDDTAVVRPLILTDDEYLRYKPTYDDLPEAEPTRVGSAKNNSTGGGASRDGHTEDEPAEDETAEDETAEDESE